MSIISANWSFPTAIRFGAGRIAELPEACAAAGMARPLLVTDRVIVNLEIFGAALASLVSAAGLFHRGRCRTRTKRTSMTGFAVFRRRRP